MCIQTEQRGRASRQTGEQPRGPIWSTEGKHALVKANTGPVITHTQRRPASLSELSASVRRGWGWFAVSDCGSRHSGKLGGRGDPLEAYGTQTAPVRSGSETLRSPRGPEGPAEAAVKGTVEVWLAGGGSQGAGWLAVVGPPLQMRGNEIV